MALGHTAAVLLPPTEGDATDWQHSSSGHLAKCVSGLVPFNRHFVVPDDRCACAPLDGRLGIGSPACLRTIRDVHLAPLPWPGLSQDVWKQSGSRVQS